MVEELHTFEWKERAQNLSADPIDIGNELEMIRERNQEKLEVSKVVAFARSESTALHECFEWDDTVAAEEYRYMQARYVIRNIVTIVRIGDDPAQMVEIPIRKYESAENGIYMDTLEMLSDDSFREKILSDIRSIIKQALQKLKDYQSILGDLSDSLQMRLVDLDDDLKQELHKEDPPEEEAK